MTTTIKKTVTAVKAEAAEGVQETLVLADTIETGVAPQLTPSLDTIQREVAGGTLTEPEDQAGRASGTLDLPMELAGPSDGLATSAPTWGVIMQGSGMKQTPCKCVVVASVFTAGDSPANRFDHDETITFTASTATARVIGQHHFDAVEPSGIRMSYLFFEELTGSVASGDTTATGSNGTATVVTLQGGDNGLRDAIAWEPWDLSLGQIPVGTVAGTLNADDLLTAAGAGESQGRCRLHQDTTVQPLIFERWLGSPAFIAGDVMEASPGNSFTVDAGSSETWYTLPSLSIETQLPGVRRALYGARGNWSINLPNNGLAGLNFNLTGKHPKPDEIVPFTGAPSAKNARPAKVTGSQVKINGVTPACFQTLTYAAEQTVALRECLTDTTGFESTLITGRTITGSMDPETVSEGLFPYLGNAWDKTAFLLETIVGDDTLEDGNAFVIRSPNTQFTNYSGADRDQIPVTNLPFKCAGGALSGQGKRDEFVLFQF